MQITSSWEYQTKDSFNKFLIKIPQALILNILTKSIITPTVHQTLPCDLILYNSEKIQKNLYNTKS